MMPNRVRRIGMHIAMAAAPVVLSCAGTPATSTALGTYELTWPAPKCPRGECDESDVHATLVLLDEKAPERRTSDEAIDLCSGQGFTLTGCYISRRGGIHRVNWRNGDRFRPSEIGLSCAADHWDRLFIFTRDDPRAKWRGNGRAGPQGAAVQIKRIGAADPERCYGPAENFTTLDQLRQRAGLPPALLGGPAD